MKIRGMAEYKSWMNTDGLATGAYLFRSMFPKGFVGRSHKRTAVRTAGFFCFPKIKKEISEISFAKTKID